MGWAGLAPARWAVRPAANARFKAPDRASSKVRIWVVRIGISPSLVLSARAGRSGWADARCLGLVSRILFPQVR